LTISLYNVQLNALKQNSVNLGKVYKALSEIKKTYESISSDNELAAKRNPLLHKIAKVTEDTLLKIESLSSAWVNNVNATLLNI
jgi:uncharacterized protein YoxC